MSQPDDPDEEPFRPASYDLTSSFTPGQPAWPPTAYQSGVQAHGGTPSGPPSPPMGGYSGVYYNGAPGAPIGPGAPRKSKGTIWIVLGIIGVLLVAACCGGGLYYRSYLTAMTNPASLSAPTVVAGMERLDDANLTATANKIAADLKSRTRARDAVAGYWAPHNDRPHLVFAAAVAYLSINPDAEARQTFDSLASTGLTVEDVHDYPAGEQGGVVRCGTSKVQSVPLSLCVWADNASAGMAGFYNRDVHDSAKLFLSVRNDLVTRR